MQPFSVRTPVMVEKVDPGVVEKIFEDGSLLVKMDSGCSWYRPQYIALAVITIKLK